MISEGITESMLISADRPAAALKRKYLQAGGSENDWWTDLSALLAACQRGEVRVERRAVRRLEAA